MKRIPNATNLHNLRTKIDLQITIAKILNSELLSDLSEVDRSLICTIASELGSNILKYAQLGSIRLNRYDMPEFTDIEIEAADHGPGIPSLDNALAEHFSSGGTLGLGLPGVKRISNKLKIDSEPGMGTRVIATKRIKRTLIDLGKSKMTSQSPFLYSSWAPGKNDSQVLISKNQTLPAIMESLDIGLRIRSCEDQRLSGDQVTVTPVADGCLIAIIDVTGHGPKAHNLATYLSSYVKTYATNRLELLMQKLHTAAKDTVGASIGLIYIDTVRSQVSYLGVGNTEILVLSARNWRGISKEGIVGLRLPSLSLQVRPFQQSDMIILHSDGLSLSSVSKELAKLNYKDASSIANYLVEKSGKIHDDASCVVIKWIK